MNKITHIFCLLTLALMIPAAHCPAQDPEEVLLTVNNHPVTLGEFERIYRKNNPDAPADRESIENYLELFIRFKLKVTEAMEQGLDTTRSFRRELNKYRSQLAKPYLSDTEYNRHLMREAWERMQTDIRASHILISLDEWAAPEDTLAAWEKAVNIRKRILAGEPFEQVARGTSDDPSVRHNGGDLGFFTAFSMIYPFETAACQMEVGEVSMPVRTRYGYHIIKVTDKRPAAGQIKVAHIMVAASEKAAEELQQQAKEKVDLIMKKLRQGEPFDNLAVEYSDDQASAARGGELPWFGVGRMTRPFEEAAFALKKNGDISDPVRTEYGWHIIKRLDHRPVGSFESMQKDLEERVTRGDRLIKSQAVFTEKLKEEYGFTEFTEHLEPLMEISGDSFFYDTGNQAEAPGMKAILFRFNGRSYTVADFAGYLQDLAFHPERMDARSFIRKSYHRFVSEKILEYENSRLEEKYPQFRHLMQEYHDGILLFEITDREVWSRAVRDSAGLAEYFRQNRSNYMWAERLDASVFRADPQVNRSRLERFLTRRTRREATLDYLNRKLRLNPADSLLTVEQVVCLPENTPWQGPVQAEPGVYQARMNGEQVWVRINRILPPEPKKLDDVKGPVTADYQEYLEEQWIKELKKKYEVTVNRDLLEKMYK
ncbi:MAG TPA: peptidylprolyl isomerase [Bacteroidetes bacterium]|nr:peptidylprolyl isomerase [Bacteroidota bacterium]